MCIPVWTLEERYSAESQRILQIARVSPGTTAGRDSSAIAAGTAKMATKIGASSAIE